MVSGGALTGGSSGGMMGGGDSSESHDTDDIPDDTDSPPALRRRVTDRSRPQSELINQILIDKFKVGNEFDVPFFTKRRDVCHFTDIIDVSIIFMLYIPYFSFNSNKKIQIDYTFINY